MHQLLARPAFWKTCGSKGYREPEICYVFNALEKRLDRGDDPPNEPAAYVYVAVEWNRDYPICNPYEPLPEVAAENVPF